MIPPTQKKKMSTSSDKCFNCGAVGHKRRDCTRSSSSSSSSSTNNNKCYRCGGSDHKQRDCNANQVDRMIASYTSTPSVFSSLRPAEPLIANKVVTNTTYTIGVKLSGMWGAKSALLDSSCDAYAIKTEFIKQLISCGYASSQDIDTRNYTPHMEVCRRSRYESGDVNVHQTMQQINSKKQFDVTVRITPNNIELALDGYHITLFYKENLFASMDVGILNSILHDVLSKYEKRVVSISNQSNTSSSSVSSPHDVDPTTTTLSNDAKPCDVCFDKPKTSILVPCGHRTVCVDCGNKLQVCPVCRTNINVVVRIFET